MKDYRGWALAEVILTNTLSACLFFSLVWDQCAYESCCGTLALKRQMRHFANILVSWWVIVSKHFLWRSVWRVPELISHLLWFIAAIRTAYCPCGWIGAVSRRKGQCWAEHQRYSQNALCLPHTRTLFQSSINTPSEYRLRLKTNTEENPSEELTLCISGRTWSWNIVNHTFIQVFPDSYEMERISIQSCVQGQTLQVWTLIKHTSGAGLIQPYHWFEFWRNSPPRLHSQQEQHVMVGVIVQQTVLRSADAAKQP